MNKEILDGKSFELTLQIEQSSSPIRDFPEQPGWPPRKCVVECTVCPCSVLIERNLWAWRFQPRQHRQPILECLALTTSFGCFAGRSWSWPCPTLWRASWALGVMWLYSPPMFQTPTWRWSWLCSWCSRIGTLRWWPVPFPFPSGMIWPDGVVHWCRSVLKRWPLPASTSKQCSRLSWWLSKKGECTKWLSYQLQTGEEELRLGPFEGKLRDWMWTAVKVAVQVPLRWCF